METHLYDWAADELRAMKAGLVNRAAELVFPDWEVQDGDRIEADFHDRRDYAEDSGWGPSQVTVSIHRPGVPQGWHHKLIGKDAEDLMDRLLAELPAKA